MEKNNKIISKIIIIILYVVGLGVFIYASIRQTSASSFLISPFGGIVMAIGVPAIILITSDDSKKKIIRLGLLVGILVCTNICFFVLNIKNYARFNIGNTELINTQSFWYCSFNKLNTDVLLYTILRNKIAVVSGDDEWYYRFVRMFSKNVEIDKNIKGKYENNRNEYYNVGAMRMRTLKDLLDEETYIILDEGIKKEKYQNLYVLISGLDKSEKIVVFSDENYNIYMRRYDE